MTTPTLPAFSLRSLLPTALLLGVSAFAASASAQTVTAPTVISAVPYTISTGGKYVLRSNLSNASTTAPAITVNANNVNLDLNGFYVSGPVGNTASTNDIVRVGDVSGVVIKNGTLANDGVGVEFTGTTDPRNYVVEGVTFTRCYRVGVLFDNPVIAGVVRYCKFSSLGGDQAQGLIAAIEPQGGVRCEKNTIDINNVQNNSNGFGVGVAGQQGDFALGNTITNSTFGIGYCTYLNNLTSGISEQAFVSGVNATGNTSVEPGNNPPKASSGLRGYGNNRR